MSYAEVLAAALALPESERSELLDELTLSLQERARGGLSEEWMKEVQRRTQAYRAGTAKTISQEELFAELERLKGSDA